MDLEQLTAQRNLYRLYLERPDRTGKDLDAFLCRSLELVVTTCAADLGYLEIYDADGHSRWSAYQCNKQKIETIRQRISSGIIAETVAKGETISTPSAFLDGRFEHRRSVQSGHIEAVLCAPIGGRGKARGIIYLQGGSSFDSASRETLLDAELFSRQVAPLLELLGEEISPDDILESSDLKGVVGRSQAFITVLRKAIAVAGIDVPVLISGETGTGKTLLAKVIHRNSRRRNSPLVHLNCANLPEQLVESELFGAKRGSHSEAHRDTAGKIAAASGGTLFLDEIGELPSFVQAKLLQFIEEGFYYPLGADTPERPNIRVIAASNINFDDAIRQKTFRADLYYRISVFSLRAPTLRERRADIADLVRFFANKFCTTYKIPAVKIPNDLDALCECAWPGNVRQLENSVQQAILLAHTIGAKTVDPSEVMRDVAGTTESFGMTSGRTYREEKEKWERQLLISKLRDNNWNISETARELALSRSYVNSLIKRYDVTKM